MLSTENVVTEKKWRKREEESISFKKSSCFLKKLERYAFQLEIALNKELFNVWTRTYGTIDGPDVGNAVNLMENQV